MGRREVERDPLEEARRFFIAELFPKRFLFVRIQIVEDELTLHGLSDIHLQHYLDEFCYRFNRRQHHKELFDRLLFACLEMEETPYAALTR